MKKYIAPLKHIFTVTDRLINSTDFLDRHRLMPTAFTRNRKMPFISIIKYLLTLPQKTLNSGLDDFFDELSPGKDITLSKQAFSKQRQLISSEAFHELFIKSTLFPTNLKTPLWNGHSLYAIDGTSLHSQIQKRTKNVLGLLKIKTMSH